MSAAWAGVAVAAIMCAAGLGAWLARLAYRAGRVEAAIELLTKITDQLAGEVREMQRSRR
jgi:hypothetical protein